MSQSSAPMPLLLQVACLMSFSVLSGCGAGSAAPEVVPVTGNVTLNGNPIAGAIVTFIPASGRPSRGTTDAAGHYELIYTSELHGAVLGSHTVQIDYGGMPEPASATAPGTKPPKTKTVPVTSKTMPQRVEVSAEANTFDFEL